MAQDIDIQVRIGGRGQSVQVVERAHDTHRSGIQCRLERRQVDVAQLRLGNPSGVIVPSSLGGRVAGKMFDTGSKAFLHFTIYHLVILVSADDSRSHHRSEVCILAIAFSHASPPRVVRHIHHRRESPADACPISLACRQPCSLLHQRGIPCSALRQRNRIDGIETMYHIARGNKRDTQSGLLDGHTLQPVDFFGSDDIEDRAHPALTNQSLFLLCIPRGVQLVHLPNLLLYGHTCQKVIYETVFVTFGCA